MGDIKTLEKDVVKALKHHGFLFEAEVGATLRKQGWKVSHSFEYLDHEKSLMREMDLVAQMTRRHGERPAEITVTLVGSCKQSKNSFAMSSKGPAGRS